MKREEKAKIIENLNAKAQEANIALVSNFKGLNVENLENLRNKLRESQVDFQVVKNTLAGIALENSPHEVIKDNFQDCCAITFGYDDPIVAAKALVDFTKQNKNFEIRFASYNGQFLDVDQIKSLAELPSREQLLAQLLRTCNAVPTNFVSLLANMLRNLLYALNAIKEQKEKT